ncbi:MAG: flavodoxin family protein [Pseudomonadota bacterium]
MKVLGIVCSPRKGGNTEILMKEVLKASKEMGAETNLITVARKVINPCDACGTCLKKGACKIDDDMTPIYSAISEADGIVLGSPVYFWSMTAQAKAIVDRTYAVHHGHQLRGKVGGAVVVARRAGCTNTVQSFFNVFNHHRMIIAGAVIAFGNEKGEVRKDEEGMKETKGLGRAMVRRIERTV